MLYPYLLMAILYFSLAVLVALDASLTSFTLIPFFSGLRWLRVHLITLGVLSEVFFGVLPGLVALHARQPRPAMRWDIWLAFNAGLLILLVGIPLVNAVLVIGGGTLIFVAVLLLMRQLRALQPPRVPSGGRAFYLAGLSYLLLGIIVGSGLWFGWRRSAGGWAACAWPAARRTLSLWGHA